MSVLTTEQGDWTMYGAVLHAPGDVRHEGREDPAVVEERGDEGVARIQDITGGLGAHSVIEAVGTQEAMMQAMDERRAIEVLPTP